MKYWLLLGFILISGCTNNSSNSINSQTLSVQASGEFGVVGYNETKLKTFFLHNNEAQALNITPVLSGENGDSFSVVSYSGCGNLLPNQKCLVKVAFSGRGKLAGEYFASLTLGSEIINLSAQIESVPAPVYALRVGNHEVDINEPLDLGEVSGLSYKIVWLRIKNVAPIRGNLSSLTLSNTEAFKILYNSCVSVALKPDQSCQVAVGLKGDNQSSTKNTVVSFDTLSVSSSFLSSTIDYSPALTATEVEIQGSVSETGQIIIKVIKLKNEGLGVGNLTVDNLPSEYALLSNNCLNVAPGKTCVVRIGITNTATDYGSVTTNLNIGTGGIQSTVDFESKLEKLGTVVLSGPSVATINECVAINLAVKELSGVDFKRAQPVGLTFSHPVYIDNNCQATTPLVLAPYASTKTLYIKSDSAQVLDLQVNFLNKTDTKTISFFPALNLASALEGLVNIPLNIPVSGGSGNYSYQIISGSGTLDNGSLTSLVAGVVVVQVHDNITQDNIETSVTVYNSLVSSGCSGAVMYDQSCDLLISGGKAPYQVVSSSGVVTNGSFFHGVCGLEENKIVNLQITDDLGQELNRTVQVDCAYNFWGDGSSGNLNTAGNVSLCDNTVDGDMCVVQYQNLTINAGHTVTTAVRRRGLIVYVQGDLVVNGTLSMQARGAVGDPVAYGVESSGLRIARIVSGESQSGSSVMAGAGNSVITAEGNQSPLVANGKIFTIQRSGAAGAAQFTKSTVNAANGGSNVGSDGALGQSGGGGGGLLYLNNGTAHSGAAGNGTCFSGGSGSGGNFNNSGTTISGVGTSFGGAGGSGAGNHPFMGGGGGAGNPGGLGGACGSMGCPGAGQTGTGGLLILIVKGNITVGPSGVITTAGSNGGTIYSGTSGGGSGGGPMLILYGGVETNNGIITAAGGTTGGGAGNIQKQQINK